MYYIIYRITNKINGKEYIGAHKTSNLDDDYMGSGIHLKRAKEKYGVENFSKEIIFRAVSESVMFFIEKMLVDKEYVARKDTYNLKLGGDGGFDYINSTGKNLYYDKNGKCLNGNVFNFTKIIDKYGSIPNLLKSRGDNSYNKYIEKLSTSLRFRYENGAIPPFKGKHHTAESKKKIGISNSISQSGELNSQYGKIRIHNDELQEEKRVKSDELEYYLNNGWLKGSLKCKCNICGISIATFMLSKHKCNIKSIIKSKNTSSIKIIKDEKIKNEAILAFNKKEKIKLDKENDINTYREYYKIYDEFGFEKFKEITNYKFSKQNLVMRFKRLLPEFKSQNGKKRGNKIE